MSIVDFKQVNATWLNVPIDFSLSNSTTLLLLSTLFAALHLSNMTSIRPLLHPLENFILDFLLVYFNVKVD